MTIKLEEINQNSEALNKVETLYLSSFPPEERRPWNDVEEKVNYHHNQYAIYVINCNDTFAGFISWWRFDDFVYIEHYAIEPHLRGRGIGEKALSIFISMVGIDVVLEVEPATTSESALRRIAFYQRCGFTACEKFPYIQPPYAPHLPSVPLMLMVFYTKKDDKKLFLDKTAALIHRYVYKKE